MDAPRVGKLLVVATPIGNLSDLSPRAVESLRRADLILAEDTRVTHRLLEAHGVSTRMQSLHEHNESRVVSAVVERLRAGACVALVSDAGTPLLSDPGFELVRRAHAAGVAVRSVPGPSAITAALSVAGLPASRFWFEGFLPPRREARRRRLQSLVSQTGTLVLFEAPHRLAECLRDLVEIFGAQREAAAARELSKLHEEVISDDLGGLLRRFESRKPRGEFVLVVAGAQSSEPEEAEVVRVLGCLRGSLPLREAAALAARITGAKRNRAYALALELDRERG